MAFVVRRAGARPNPVIEAPFAILRRGDKAAKPVEPQAKPAPAKKAAPARAKPAAKKKAKRK